MNRALLCTLALASAACAQNWQQQPNWLAVEDMTQHAVVQIINRSAQKNICEPYRNDESHQLSTGSGFFINEEGEILTNYHVIEGAKKLEICLPSLGRDRFEIELVGCKPERDIALVRLTESGKEKFKKFLELVPGCNGIIQYLELCPFDEQHPAQEVMAIGYPLNDGLKRTIGHISGISQVHKTLYCQLTAPINPGNSGGPTVNGYGHVIGINSAGIVRAQNVGYMIPIHHIRNAIDDMRKHRVITFNMLKTGLFTQPATDNIIAAYHCPHEGLFIFNVLPNSFASEAGFEAHDIICAINGKALDNYGLITPDWVDVKIDCYDIIESLSIGSPCTFLIWRNNDLIELTTTIQVRSSFAIDYHYAEEDPLAYRVYGGIVVQPLTLNFEANDEHQDPYCAHALYGYLNTLENVMNKRLMITKIHEYTQAENEHALSAGAIIDTVNGMVIHTIDDLDAAIANTQEAFITIIFTNHTVAVLDRNLLLEEDKELRSVYHYPQAPGLAALQNAMQE